jgi:hypothetical protein
MQRCENSLSPCGRGGDINEITLPLPPPLRAVKFLSAIKGGEKQCLHGNEEAMENGL